MKLKRIMVSVWIALFAVLGSVTGFTAQTAQAAVSDWQQGVTYQPYSSNELSGEQYRSAMRSAAAQGANYATIIVQYRQDNIYSNGMYETGETPSDASLRDGINYAHSLGMKVMLKPHVDPNDGNWRAYINPSNRTEWFANYATKMAQLGTLATQMGVEQMCIGAELVYLTRPDRSAQNTPGWNSVIDKLKTTYGGPLTYSGQRAGDATMDEVSNIAFWNRLNYIGVSAYYPVSGGSVEQMKSDWAQIDNSYLKPVQAKYGKPFLFTEVGYRSASNAAAEPYTYQGGYEDQALQARLYQALFEYWNTKPASYMNGVALWDYNSQGGTSYNPINKQAEAVIKQWFGGSGAGQGNGGSTPTPAPSATPAPTVAPTPTPVPTNTNPGMLTTTASAQRVQPGQATTVTTNVTAQRTASSILIDTEIFDTNGNKVWQKYSENNQLVGGIANASTGTWTPATSGTYTIKVGVFSNGWSQNYSWNDAAGSVVVATNTATPAPTPVPTATPVPTPAPTKAPTPAPTPTPTPTSTPVPTPSPAPTTAPTTGTPVTIWWPSNGASVTGVQPFKARLNDVTLNTYKMFWQVDGGTLNEMGDSNQDGAHKESSVNVGGWNWQNSNQYRITFVAKDLYGKIISTKDAIISISK